MADMINKPPHYHEHTYEPIEVIDEWTAGLVGMDAICVGHILRYVSRWHKKNGLEDLKKARYYMYRLVDRPHTYKVYTPETSMFDVFNVCTDWTRDIPVKRQAILESHVLYWTYSWTRSFRNDDILIAQAKLDALIENVEGTTND